jgi:hypothetical protein
VTKVKCKRWIQIQCSRRCNKTWKFFAPVTRIQFLSNFAMLLDEVGSQTVGPPYCYQYQQLTPQHGLMKLACTQHSWKVLLVWIWKSATSTSNAYRPQKAIIWVFWCVNMKIDIVAIQETHTTWIFWTDANYPDSNWLALYTATFSIANSLKRLQHPIFLTGH